MELGGYDEVNTLHALEGKVQIYMPDLKYLDSTAAERYSGAPDYPEKAAAAIRRWCARPAPMSWTGTAF